MSWSSMHSYIFRHVPAVPPPLPLGQPVTACCTCAKHKLSEHEILMKGTFPSYFFL